METEERGVVDGRAPLVLALLGDLMLESRVQTASEGLGYRFRSADALPRLDEALDGTTPDLVVLDLASLAFPAEETLARLDALPSGSPRVIAFFPHVMKELGRQAEAIGCAVVVPRSRFVAEMAALIRGAVEAR
jgi:hypothetical protein